MQFDSLIQHPQHQELTSYIDCSWLHIICDYIWFVNSIVVGSTIRSSRSAVAKSMIAVGFEPTPPERLEPKSSALDHSATLPWLPGSQQYFLKYWSQEKKSKRERNLLRSGFYQLSRAPRDFFSQEMTSYFSVKKINHNFSFLIISFIDSLCNNFSYI